MPARNVFAASKRSAAVGPNWAAVAGISCINRPPSRAIRRRVVIWTPGNDRVNESRPEMFAWRWLSISGVRRYRRRWAMADNRRGNAGLNRPAPRGVSGWGCTATGHPAIGISDRQRQAAARTDGTGDTWLQRGANRSASPHRSPPPASLRSPPTSAVKPGGYSGTMPLKISGSVARVQSGPAIPKASMRASRACSQPRQSRAGLRGFEMIWVQTRDRTPAILSTRRMASAHCGCNRFHQHLQ